MDSDQIQYVIPPGMAEESAEVAQRLIDALPKENLIIDFVALMAAFQTYIMHSEYPKDSFADSWEEFAIGHEDQIGWIAHSLEFPFPR